MRGGSAGQFRSKHALGSLDPDIPRWATIAAPVALAKR